MLTSPKLLASVMQDFDETLEQTAQDSLADIPDFLLKIKTLEDALQADQWGREQAGKVLKHLH